MTLKFNLDLFAKERPVEAIRLEQWDARSCKRVKDNNLQMEFGLLYQKKPLEEAQKWFHSLSLDKTQVLYVYGVGLGVYFLALKDWVEKDPERHLVFFEDDLTVLKRFMEEKVATEILQHPQVNVCYLEDAEDAQGVLETLYWSFVMTPFQVVALRSYEEHKNQKFEAFKYKITSSTMTKDALVDEYLRYGGAFFKNFYPNMLELHRSNWGNALFGKFKGVPAIICGAGPSLEKQLTLLKQLHNNALIFAGGSSLNAITQQNILPHFGAGIDPNQEQLSRILATRGRTVPFFYRSRMLHEAVREIQGPRLYISGAGGYDIAEWYEEKFNIAQEFLDEGHNVVNFCTEIALRLGCDPLIYIGLDLAYTDKKAYANGVNTDALISVDALLNEEDPDKRGILRTDIYGKPIITLWKWIAEADWLGQFAKDHPEITLINATEGGLGFPNVPTIPFAEVAESHLKKKFSLKNRVQKEIKKAALTQVTEEKLREATEELKRSLQRCVENINVLNLALEKEKRNPETKGVASSGLAALAETELFEEPAYKYLLDIFHQVYARVQNKRVVALRLNRKGISEHQISLEKIALQEEKLRFIRNVAEANIVLINHFSLEKIAQHDQC